MTYNTPIQLNYECTAPNGICPYHYQKHTCITTQDGDTPRLCPHLTANRKTPQLTTAKEKIQQ